VLTVTYTEKITRGAAINTIKRWVPDVQPMDALIREFALKLLRRLQSPGPSPDPMDVDAVVPSTEDNMEDGQLPTEALVKTPYLSEALKLPAERGQVLQHLELMFALTVKVPEFLDELVFSCCPVLAHLPIPVDQDIRRVWANGQFRPDARSGTYQPSHPRTRIFTRKIVDAAAYFPQRCRISRLADCYDLHGQRQAQCTACDIGEGFGVRERPRRTLLDPYNRRDG
jgi:hypothetical protein